MLRARPCARAGGRLDGAGSCVDELCLDYPWIEELQIGAHVAAAIALDREPSELVCRRVQLSGDASTAPRLS